MVYNAVKLLILLAFTPILVFGQTINGVIIDSETDLPLPSATVLHEGTFRGTIANSDGEFSIKIVEFPAAILVRYIGYESKRIELEKWQSEPITIRLNRSVTEMDEIVVTDRDPGLSIMERVIERKKLWRSDLDTYEADAYTRQVLRNDTAIVSITESRTRSFWDAEKGQREVQLYRHQTTNIGEDQNFAGVRFLPNFYDDNVTVAGFDVVGITNPEALQYYDFSLAETLQIDNQPVYKIEVIPKRRLQPLFQGYAYVLGGEYALLEVDVKPNDVVDFPPPIREFDLSYSQQFSNFGENFWLPVDMRVSGTIRIEMVGLRFPAIQFSQTSTLSEYRVNVDLPDSLYEKSQMFTRTDADTAIDMSQRLVPLTDEERLAYEMIDSTETLDKAFEPEGFLSGFIGDDDDSSGLLGTGRFLPEGVQPIGRFNRVDGFNAGLRAIKNINSSGSQVAANGSYSFHAKQINFGFSAGQELYSGKRVRINVKAGYENDIRPVSEGSRYPVFLNSVQALAGGRDYFNYYQSETVSGGIEFRRIVPKTDLKIEFKSSTDRSVLTDDESVFDFSIFDLHRTRPANRPVWGGNINSMNFELDFNRFGPNFGVSGSRNFRLLAEYSGSELGSDFKFTTFRVDANWNTETFFKRRVFANTFDLNLSAGYTFGNLPPQRLSILDGSMGRFTPFGTIKTRQSMNYEGSRFWLITGEHNFRTIPFELLGLRPLADRGWGIILFGGAGYSSADADLYEFSPFVTNGIHSEVGISLNSIFGILRVDLAMRLDAPGSFIGISLPRYF